MADNIALIDAAAPPKKRGRYKHVAMEGQSVGPYIIFVEYTVKSNSSTRYSAPILLKARTERESSDAASAVADFLFSELASEVLIRVVSGDSVGRPIAEIRRPISN